MGFRWLHVGGRLWLWGGLPFIIIRSTVIMATIVVFSSFLYLLNKWTSGCLDWPYRHIVRQHAVCKQGWSETIEIRLKIPPGTNSLSRAGAPGVVDERGREDLRGGGQVNISSSTTKIFYIGSSNQRWCRGPVYSLTTPQVFITISLDICLGITMMYFLSNYHCFRRFGSLLPISSCGTGTNWVGINSRAGLKIRDRLVAHPHQVPKTGTVCLGCKLRHELS